MLILVYSSKNCVCTLRRRCSGFIIKRRDGGVPDRCGSLAGLSGAAGNQVLRAAGSMGGRLRGELEHELCLQAARGGVLGYSREGHLKARTVLGRWLSGSVQWSPCKHKDLTRCPGFP